jgi:hypothetical protein
MASAHMIRVAFFTPPTILRRGVYPWVASDRRASIGSAGPGELERKERHRCPAPFAGWQ